MKKFGISIGLAIALCVSAFAGCSLKDFQWGGTADVPPETEQLPSVSEEPREEEQPEQAGVENREEQVPAPSPLALLDTIDVSAAFGESEAEGWSFALRADGDLDASYGFILTSELSDSEKLNIEFGAGLGLEDLFGLRSNDGNALGFDLFGGGQASLSLRYRGPTENSEPVSKDLAVGFRHDGDFIWYAKDGEEETKTSLSGLDEKIGAVAMTETFDRMKTAFSVIPEELGKGVSLRFAVEKLIDLGFVAEIDDTDGLTVTLKAGGGFYTDLLNDLLEEFIPSDWLDYLPRADFHYERTVFDIKLAFDANGLFREYSMSSDVALTSSLEVRNLFYSESSLKLGGGLSFTAYSGEIPADGIEA